jgi:GntR family transcriptional regulator
MSETLYAQVARDLTEGIASGRFPVGSLLPTELDLCAHYGASRYTVRAAIRELQELGLVSRRRKVGTRVEAASPSSGYRQTLGSVEDLVQFGETHVRTVRDIREVEADHRLAKQLGCPVGTRWLRISSLRSEGDPSRPPLGWTEVYVDAAYAELGEIVRASPGTLISTLIETRYGRRIAEIRQDVGAVLVPSALAKELEVPAGTAALRVTRRYLDQAGETFEISITVHPADCFTVSTRLTRQREQWARASDSDHAKP